jgi:hypothetical protein
MGAAPGSPCLSPGRVATHGRHRRQHTRYRVGTDHVESWFARANDPTSPRAIWLKATLSGGGASLSQACFSAFDGERTEAFCLDVPLPEAAPTGTSYAAPTACTSSAEAVNLFEALSFRIY